MPKPSRREVARAITDDAMHLFDQPGERRGRGKVAKAKPKAWEPPQRTEDNWTRRVKPRSDGQARLIEAVDESDIVFAVGPAGTGKTHIAVSKAHEALETGRVRRIILCRPAVEAGERLGFLPGGPESKVEPYMRPLYDVLYERMGGRNLAAKMAEKTIEIAPLAFLRGRTLTDAAIVIDESQNATKGQLAMVLTRLGAGSFMVLTGDPSPHQIDIAPGTSGFLAMADALDGKVGRVSVVRLSAEDVVRHPVVREMLPLLAAA